MVLAFAGSLESRGAKEERYDGDNVAPTKEMIQETGERERKRRGEALNESNSYNHEDERDRL